MKCIGSYLAAFVLALNLIGPAAAQPSTSPTEAMSHWRAGPPPMLHGQTVTELPTGFWLLLGGEDANRRPTRLGTLLDGTTGRSTVPAPLLSTPRLGHTATIISTGQVIVLGGIGDDGKLVQTAEYVRWREGVAEQVATLTLIPRAFHTATVLTDGRLLIVGGVGVDGRVVTEVEVINFVTQNVEKFDAKMESVRFGHFASLLPAAPVLIWGGFNRENQNLTTGELFDPATSVFSPLNAQSRALLPNSGDQAAMPVVAGSRPEHGSNSVPIDQIVSVRFSKPMEVTTLTGTEITLFGPHGVVPVDIVPVELGLLVFVQPRQHLLPDSAYTLFVRGARDFIGLPMGLATTSFRTQSIAADAQSGIVASATSENSLQALPLLAIGTTSTPQGAAYGVPSEVIGARTDTTTGMATTTQDAQKRIDNTSQDVGEDWFPGQPEYQSGNWRTNRPLPYQPRQKSGGNMRSASGAAGVSGLVLKLNDQPLSGVTLRIGKNSTVSQSDGSFLLDGVPSGKNTLIIEGATAGVDYGYFETLVELVPGEITSLPFNIWIPKLDRQSSIRIASPTIAETRITTPRMPGFAVVIPPGVVVRDRAGKIVTDIGITPIPIDRTPFPLPIIFEFNTYYTIQPAGATLESIDGTPAKARVIYPNYAKVPAGDSLYFWNYDAYDRGWHVYGDGVVSADAQTIVPGPDVGIYQFAGFMISVPGTLPPAPCPCPAPGGDGGPSGGGPPTPGSPFDGDPVNLATGSFVHAHTDLVVNDVVPLTLRRIHNSRDAGGGQRPFGQSTLSGMDYWLYNPYPNGLYGAVDRIFLTPPDGSSVEMQCIVGCTQAGYATFEVKTPGYFYKGTMTIVGSDWVLRTRDGANFTFYGSGGRIKHWTDRNGNKTRFVRSPADIGVLVAVVSPNGKSIEFAYEGAKIAEATDNIGRKWRYAYTGNLLTSATDPIGGVWQYTYDTSSGVAQMSSVRDPRGNLMVTNEYEYSVVKKQTFADGSSTSFAWTFGPPNWQYPMGVAVTNRRGFVRKVLLENFYITSDTLAFGTAQSQTTTFVRDPVTKLLTTTTDPLGNVTQFSYDSKGNVATRTRFAGTSASATDSYVYDSTFSRLMSKQNAAGLITSYSRDAFGNMESTSDPLAHQIRHTFTTAGLAATKIDALNNTTSYSYTAGTLTQIMDPLNRVTSWEVDGAGRMVRSVDPAGATTLIENDALNRTTRITDPLGNSTRYEFDPMGNLTAHVDQNGNRITYAYDVMNRLTTRTDALLGIEQFTYDVGSNLIGHLDRDGRYTGFMYDELGRRVQAGFGGTAQAPLAYESTAVYTYDKLDRLISATGSHMGSVSRTYDASNRLATETTSTTVVSYSYDSLGRRSSREVTGQPTLTYVWDNANRLLQLVQGADTVTFGYDSANRRTTIQLPNGVLSTYTYDDASQLTRIDYSRNGSAIGDVTYTYDTSGRRTSVGGTFWRTSLPKAMPMATYNANNQLVQWGLATHTYDGMGNLTSDGTSSYVWNAQRQLSEVRQGATTVASFGYDPLGRRSFIRSESFTQFVYDGRNFVQERTETNSVSASLITGLGLDEVFVRTQGATSSNLLLDHLGSVIAETDASGSVTGSNTFEPYGSTTRSGSESNLSQKFTAREEDLPDLYFYRARYYLPITGRFASEDPIDVRGGGNLYGYAIQSPTQYTDPLGLAPCLYPIWCPPDSPGAPPGMGGDGAMPNPWFGPGSDPWCIKCKPEELQSCLAQAATGGLSCLACSSPTPTPPWARFQSCVGCVNAGIDVGNCYRENCDIQTGCGC